MNVTDLVMHGGVTLFHGIGNSMNIVYRLSLILGLSAVVRTNQRSFLSSEIYNTLEPRLKLGLQSWRQIPGKVPGKNKKKEKKGIVPGLAHQD
jgi:hypothetical protein